jgi:hypothetical protein
MMGRRVVIGLSLLSALLFSAFMAPSAFAVGGTTAFTCAPEPKPTPESKGFSDEHCLKAASGLNVKFVHTPFEGTTVVEGTAEKTKNETKEATEPVLKSVAAGVEVILSSKTMTTAGELTNVGGVPMKVTGKKIVITFGTVEVTKGPAGCKVKGGKIVTKNLVSETKEMEVVFKPEAGAAEPFATFEFEGAGCILNGVVFKVTGSAKALPNGATLETTEASTEGKGKPSENNGLWLSGQKATFTSQSTIRRAVGGNPITLTTE